MKKIFYFTMTLLISALMSSYALASKSNELSLDRIIVTINDSVITQAELDDAIDNVKKSMAKNNVPIPSDAVLHKQILDQLINRKLQLLVAEQGKLTISDKELEKTIQGIAQQNHMNISQLYQKLSMEGMTKEAYRKEVREELTLQKLEQQEIGSKIVILPQEITDFMKTMPNHDANASKEYHLEDILVTIPDAPSSEQVLNSKKQAEELADKIRKGMNFNEAAAKLQGGDLGWRKLPEIPSAFATKLTGMKPGDILGPIQAPNGFHIIHLAGIRDGVKDKQLDSRQEAQRIIFQRKFDEAMRTWVSRLRSESFINMHPG